MTGIARNIAANGDCSCSAGEILVVELAFRQAPDSNALAPLAGKQFVATIYRTSDRAELFSFAGQVGPEGDGTLVRFVIPGTATTSVFVDERGSASWQIAEVVGSELDGGGLKYWVKGRFSVRGAAESVTPAEPVDVAPPPTRIIIDATTQRVLNDSAQRKPLRFPSAQSSAVEQQLKRELIDRIERLSLYDLMAAHRARDASVPINAR